MAARQVDERSRLIDAINDLLRRVHGVTGPLFLTDGTVADPALAFAADTNNGLYRIGADDWGLSAGGLLTAELKVTGGNRQFLVADGAEATPALGFITDTDNGFYKLGTNNWAAVAGGTLTQRWLKTGSDVQALFAEGSATLPSIAITTDSDTGFYRVGANRLGVAANGQPVAEFAWTVGAGVMLGVGVAPSVAFHVAKTQVGDHVAIVTQSGSSSGDKGLKVEQGSTTATDAILLLSSDSTTRFAVYGDGSIKGKGGEPLQKIHQTDAAAANLTLTNAFQSFGTPITESLGIGNWLVVGTFYFVNGGTLDIGQSGEGQLVTSGGTATISNSGAVATGTFETANTSTTITRVWGVNVTAATTAELKARKTGGTGSSVCFATRTTMECFFMGNPV